MLMAAAAVLTSCGQPSSEQNNMAAAAAAKPKEKPRYCFFKEDGTKGWTASRGSDGNITVKGRAYRQDGRYKAVLGEAKVIGTTAEVWPSITTNPSYSSPDGWWDVSATIPNSSGVDSVAVRCGKRTLAELKVARKG
jgi:hypothetical protein